MPGRRLRYDFADQRERGPEMRQAGINAVLFLAFILIAGWLMESRRHAKKAQRSSETCDGFPYTGSSGQRERVDVNQVIGEIICLLRADAARYSIALHSDLANHLPEIVAERAQLRQVLTNLMLNAIEAMKNAAQPNELCIRSRREGDRQVRVSICDTGVGPPNESPDPIGAASNTARPQESGMGLRISRSILESMDGHLWVIANADRGTTFHCTLPAAG